jgi:hypothetical protein
MKEKWMMAIEDEEIGDLSPQLQRAIKYVATRCAMVDGNGAFDGLPEMVRADYLHDVRSAIEGLSDYAKNGGVTLDELRKELGLD